MDRQTRVRAGVACLMLALASCGASMQQWEDVPKSTVKMLTGAPPASPIDISIKKVTTDASILIVLQSNKQKTSFNVNGVALDDGKTIKVLVPNAPLRIVAQAPCYREQVQTAQPDGFAPYSLFEFTFADWDKAPGQKTKFCS